MNGKSCKFCVNKSFASNFLNDNELKMLEKSCVDVQFSKGDVIFKQNALSSNIIFVKSGLVKIHITGPDREQILKIIKGPTYLGIPTTFGDKVNHYSATAIMNTSVCFIDLNSFKEFIASNSNFAYEIITELCKNELAHFAHCVNQVQKQSQGRIAEALCFFADEIFNETTFDLPLSRQEFGDLTGNSRESVSRILANLNSDGVISLNGKNIEILDIERLRSISKNG
ncbi:Crp/Fnr family transcriptional regulator [Ancylomarina longa]|uniref:Crp/Fnr family transcriptional regulator n=1 Tax=Ancylomarina longa TaxID=2487017 RepID=A0A434ATB5_9BACT|nr:Crp/Fnr family transcriptional regulator [Ancylomarina longa]RUT77663.1 Crp/Fnr family transcriptional regulator [Ancylomarina longa]